MLKIKQDPKLLVINKNQPLYVPLEKVKIEATIHFFTADVIITQVFRNNEETLIEAIYYFPIKNQETVYAFIARVDDREIVIQSKENDNNTLDQNSFTIDIGALPPSKECRIIMTYVTKLNFIHESTIQFIVPTIITSLADTNSEYFQINPYTVEFHCSIEQTNESQHQQRIHQVSSTSHPVQVYRTEQNTYIVTFIQQNTYFNRDILINIQLNDMIKEDCHQILTNEYIFHTDSNILTTNSVGQPFDYYCVLDFEAVCHQANPNLKRPSPNDIWEIIEFPICLLEAETNSIIDIYHSYVRPTIKSS
jgi:hypothetical protein